MFLNRNRERYDIAFVDLFNSHYTIPFHAGREAIGKLADAMEDDGIIAMNIIGAIEGAKGRLFKSIWQSIRERFPHARAYTVRFPEHPENMQNIVVIASRSPLPDIEKPKIGIDPGFLSIRHMAENSYRKGIPLDVEALADDFAPVDRYFMEMEE